MAKTLAFKVKRDSDFYAMYFDAKEERMKFKSLAVPFFEKYGSTLILAADALARICNQLGV